MKVIVRVPQVDIFQRLDQINNEQLLPFLMAVARRGQEKKVTFSDEEINTIAAVLKKHATPEELSKMDKILSMRARS